MQLKTILNCVERHKSFVYGEARMLDEAGPLRIEVPVRPRANGRPVCSGCRRTGPGYDRLPERRFEFVPVWAIPVFFVYAMRRVDCPTCGVTVEQVPWGDGNGQLTRTYRWFLARWARRMSWKEVATIFRTSWDSVYRSVEYAVLWGVVHRDVSGVEALGVDEIQWQRGQNYLTLVYQIDAGCRRLLYVAKDRTAESLRGFFRLLGEDVIATLRFVCSDMWKAYLEVIREEAPAAIHVLDRFHIMARINKAIDEVRAAEAKRLAADGYEPVLKHSRWCLLKRRENLTARQTVKLSELLKYNLKSVSSMLQRDDFQRFWEYRSPGWAAKFLHEWCTRVMRSKIEPMKKIARMLRKHEHLILNWFRAEGSISAGTVEGLNNKVKLTMRKAYGFRTYQAIEMALYHNLGALPEPKFTHDFC